MKKILSFSALLVAILALGILTERITFARVTSSADDRDAWCVGPDGAEVCVDSSGNMIPTTDDDTDLGTPSLQWQDIYSDGTIYSDAISLDGNMAATTASFTGTVAHTGAITVKTNTVTVSTSATSDYSLALCGAVVTLSTHTITNGCLVRQMSDDVVYLSTKTVAIGDNNASCVLTGCYKALH